MRLVEEATGSHKGSGFLKLGVILLTHNCRHEHFWEIVMTRDKKVVECLEEQERRVVKHCVNPYPGRTVKDDVVNGAGEMFFVYGYNVVQVKFSN